MTARREAGSTLIELLAAVAIMGIAFAVILGGIGTAIIGSDVQKQQAGADVALHTAAESITYTSCATPTDYQPTQPLGFAVTVTAVTYWNAATNAFESPSTCVDTGLQLIELSALPTSGRQAAPETLRVVKRRP